MVWDLWYKTQSLPSADELQRGVSSAKADLARAQKAKRPPQEIESLEGYIQRATSDLELVREFAPIYEAKRTERDRKSRRLLEVEQRIASLFDASRDVNRFRTNVTYTFGVLVFFVIVGFYLIAWNKQGVATTIFSGEMGMQFVTLFLIVIAIILFGIMGTLEGRELAALLGGLSGYILGRADSRRRADGGEGVNNSNETK